MDMERKLEKQKYPLHALYLDIFKPTDCERQHLDCVCTYTFCAICIVQSWMNLVNC